MFERWWVCMNVGGYGGFEGDFMSGLCRLFWLIDYWLNGDVGVDGKMLCIWVCIVLGSFYFVCYFCYGFIFCVVF